MYEFNVLAIICRFGLRSIHRLVVVVVVVAIFNDQRLLCIRIRGKWNGCRSCLSPVKIDPNVRKDSILMYSTYLFIF